MPPKDDALYIEEILEAIQRITKYTSGGEQDFFSKPMIQDAGALNLIVIGEAAKHLSPHSTAKAADIPWQRVAGLRDRLTHAYTATDPHIVWKVIVEDLESLRVAAEKMRH